MKIDYAVPSPENVTRIAQGRGEILHVGLRYEAATDGDDKINEVLVRKSKYDTLTTAKKLAYAVECEQWHHKRDATVRAKWDADDKAKAEAKFLMRHVANVENGVRVFVTWLGFTAEYTIPNDSTNAVANAQALHQAEKAKRDAEVAMVSAFNVG